MAQDLIKMNNTTIWQPLAEMGWNWATTYTEDSTRTQDGKGHFTTMFTVEQLEYEGYDLPASEVKKILNIIAKGNSFTLHYFSPYYNQWRDDTFYVGQGSLNLETVIKDGERVSNLKFNMTGVNPL